MRTVIIWDECGTMPLCWVIVNGDYSHLSGYYINDSNCPDEIAQEISDLMYDSVTGEFRHERNSHFKQMPRDSDVVFIHAGFLP